MDTTIKNISIPEQPLEEDFADWILNHPDCDTIFEKINGSSNILVYAYALNDDGNDDLLTVRKQRFPEKELLQGVSQRGLRQLI